MASQDNMKLIFEDDDNVLIWFVFWGMLFSLIGWLIYCVSAFNGAFR